MRHSTCWGKNAKNYYGMKVQNVGYRIFGTLPYPVKRTYQQIQITDLN